ncbi:hypothetical protein [Glaciimonas immobilis]|uniref:Uncharacterized protein n=1 Tax=Glaciimonas immobilis TaxID=728004 RepID=A0A840RSR2_9BURK|nr:hypothetical protein [Glaciimonas immobilis]KAF3996848.1 hypothetical protein HAV38_16820 [Glaciimonas immobilis]MBB5199600.1 hypothetical protein [Glaciimonas immobilis]
MKTTRGKRWDGAINSLAVEFLKDAMEQMIAYGDRVQFALGTGQRPHYQVINSSDKKMAFNSTHHLLHPVGEEFDPGNVSMVYSLDQIKAAIAGVNTRSSAASRAPRAKSVGGTRTSAVKIQDVIDSQKYDYFKLHRDLLPPSIGEYSVQITDLMKLGSTAEEAFDTVIKLHF